MDTNEEIRESLRDLINDESAGELLPLPPAPPVKDEADIAPIFFDYGDKLHKSESKAKKLITSVR